MRFEELQGNMYQKSTDSVERYLMSLVELYYNSRPSADPLSREYIIEQTVARAKSELNFDGIGVTSIQLPDDEEPRTGAVQISLEELGGEPRIEVKHEAFNVDFGTEHDTACEGNDPRLSDARPPLEHQHSIEDIQGLEGMLTTFKTAADYSQQFSHSHDNQSVLDKLIYTGQKAQIDLAQYEQWEQDLYDELQTINDAIKEYKQYNDNVYKKYVNIISATRDQILNALKGLVDNGTLLEQAKKHTDERFDKSTDDVNNILKDYIQKTEALSLLSSIEGVYVPAGKMTCELSSYLTAGHDTQKLTQISIPLGNLKEMLTSAKSKIGDEPGEDGGMYPIYETLEDVIKNKALFDIKITYNGENYYNQYNILDNTSGDVKASMTIGIDETRAELIAKIYNPQGNLPDEIKNCKITVALSLPLKIEE